MKISKMNKETKKKVLISTAEENEKQVLLAWLIIESHPFMLFRLQI